MIFAFGEYELDARQYRLRRVGEVIRLQPKVFSVLQYLIEHRDRVVSKHELLDEIWPDETLTESVLARTIAVARKALGQKRGEREPIETDYGRGYRFTAPLRVIDDPVPSSMPAVPAAPEEAQVTADLLEQEPFVGRTQVMERLRSRMASAQAGRGGLCLLVGEAGIGKTRAAEELMAEPSAQGVRVWTGRCFEGEGSPPFWLWIQILRACAREESPARLREFVGQGRDGLLALEPELALAAGLPVAERAPSPLHELPDLMQEQRFRLLDSIHRFLTHAAEDRLRVLLLDDLHWADPTSLELLSFLVPDLASSRLLLVGTLRDPELPPNHPNRTQLDRIVNAPETDVLRLGGLTEGDIDAYIRGLTGAPAPAGLAAAVHTRTEGNPFFMRESLQLLTDATGRLGEEVAGAWDVRLPQVVRDVIRRRVSQIDVELRAVLEVASVMGREFDFTTLEAASGLGNRALLDALGEALALGLIEELPESVGRYGFHHVLIQETLYDDTPTRMRVQMHRKVAESLAQRFGSDKARLSEISFHFHRAMPDGTGQQALHFATEAGGAARRVYAYEEAAHHYEMAIKALEFCAEAELSRRFTLTLDLAVCLSQSGQTEQAIATYGRALSLAREMADPVAMGWAVMLRTMVCRFYYRSMPDDARVLREVLQGVPGDEIALRSRLMLETASLLVRWGKQPEVAALCSQAVELLQREDTMEARFRTLTARLLPLQGPQRLPEAVGVLEDILRLGQVGAPAAGQVFEPWMEFLGRQNRYSTRLELGDVRGADEDLEHCERLARGSNMRLGRWFVSVARVGRALADGRLEGLAQEIEQVASLGRRMRTPAARLVFNVHFSELLLTQGAHEALARGGPDMTGEAEWAGPYVHMGMARFLALVGREQEARSLIDAAFPDGYQTVHEAPGYLSAMGNAAEACHLLGDRERAGPLYELLFPYADRLAVEESFVYRSCVAHYLGLLAALLGDIDGAQDHLLRAIEIHDRTGMRPMAAVSRFELARLLLEHNRSGDGSRVQSLVERATEAARRIGMANLLAKLHALPI